MAQLVFQHSLWWILPILLSSVGLAILLYYKAGSFSRGERWLLGGIRFLLVFLLGFFLLSPMLKRQLEEQEKPILLWLQDASASVVLHKDSLATKAWLRDSTSYYQELLTEKFQVVPMPFADGLLDSTSFNGSYTNLSAALQNAQSNYYNQNVGAAVLLSDGIYNRGANPLYAAKFFSAPLYPLMLGDSVQYADLRISALRHNDEAFLENEFAVNLDIEANGLSGKRAQLELRNQEGKVLLRESISISKRDQSFNYQFFIKPEAAGLRKYSLSLSPLQEEVNLRNNQASFTLNISNRQIRVAVIGKGPHPDVYAIKAALTGSQRFKVTDHFGRVPGKETLAENTLFVLHQPSAAQMQAVLASGKAFWLLNGPNTAQEAIRAFLQQPVSDQFEPTAARLNTSFSLFSIPDEINALTRSAAPLLSPFGKLPAPQGAAPLFYKQVGNVVTADPLWYYHQEGKRKTTVTQGINLWRWRIEDYRLNGSFNLFDALINATVTYLSLQENEERFSVLTKRKHRSGEMIPIKAHVLNQNNALSNQARVKLVLTNEENESFTYGFSKEGKAYALRLQPLPEGIYRYQATAELGEERFLKVGNFEVEEVALEANDLTARFGLMRNMALTSGGEAYTLLEVKTLVTDLLDSPRALPVATVKTKTEPLISVKLFFFLLFTLAGLEWVLRKYFGKY